MGKDDDDEAFEAWQHSETVQGPLYRLWEAEKAARTANDPVKREAGRTALGAAAGAFLEGTGVTEQLQQQMLEHVLGELDGGAAYAGKTFEELTRPEMARTKGGLAVLRALAERGVLTLFTLLGAKFSATTVADLRGSRGATTVSSRSLRSRGSARTAPPPTTSRKIRSRGLATPSAAGNGGSRRRCSNVPPPTTTAALVPGASPSAADGGTRLDPESPCQGLPIAVQKGTADREGGKVYNNRGLRMCGNLWLFAHRFVCQHKLQATLGETLKCRKTTNAWRSVRCARPTARSACLHVP